MHEMWDLALMHKFGRSSVCTNTQFRNEIIATASITRSLLTGSESETYVKRERYQINIVNEDGSFKLSFESISL